MSGRSSEDRRRDQELRAARRSTGGLPERRLRRRGPRPVAIGALAVGVVVVGIAVGAALSGGRSPASPRPAAHASTAKHHRKTVTHRVSTSAAALKTAAQTTPAAVRDTASWTRVGAAARRTAVPILMYHLVAAAPAGTAYPGLWVPPTLLRQQVAALKAAGFTGVTLGEAWDAWHGTGRLPAHPVVLSFDDGDISQALGAAPVLKDVGWPGVLNLAVSHLGKGGIPMWGARRLIKQGWEIDSHTIDHLDVTTLNPAALRHQLVGSKVLIKRQLGVDARFFCYPAGRNNPTSQAAVKAAGYLAATTVAPGIATRSDDPFTLPRIRVEPTTTPAELVALAKGQATAPAGSGVGE